MRSPLLLNKPNESTAIVNEITASESLSLCDRYLFILCNLMVHCVCTDYKGRNVFDCA